MYMRATIAKPGVGVGSDVIDQSRKRLGRTKLFSGREGVQTIMRWF